MEKIIPVNVSEQFRTDYQRYGIYLTYRRILADMRDGLKPVQRRMLYTLLELGATDHTIKSATVNGACMKYHPHGTCLRGNTKISMLDGTVKTIQELYNSETGAVQILSINPVTGQTVPAIAHSFRIGQYTNQVYHIMLSNGTEIVCTSNHPFMLPNLKFVQAKDLKPYSRLMIKSINLNDNGRPLIDGVLVQQLVHDYYFGMPPTGYHRHHKDTNIHNNTPENLVALTNAEHRLAHTNNPELNSVYLNGLALGRERMFHQEGAIREAIKLKNKRLANILSQHQALMKIKLAFKILLEHGMEITYDNYESLRTTKEIYNLPIIERFLKRHPEYGCKTFEDLITCDPPEVGALYNEVVKSENEDMASSFAISQNYVARLGMYSVIDSMIDNGIELTVENYISSLIESKNRDVDLIQSAINCYKYERPYIQNIWIENVNNEPMYDFTVYGYENMIIPMYGEEQEWLVNQIGHVIPAICLHNSGCYDAAKGMINWFECYLPLMTPQGNFGNFDGDPPGADRYTEMKLSNFAKEYVVGDLRDTPESVDWAPNYDNTCQEPSYLPAALPLLLINGSFGIGLGKRVDIPSHNTNEVIDAIITLMQNPNAEIALIPDTCMPCEIFDDTDWQDVSDTGYGYYTVRGIVSTETYSNEKYKNRPALVIKSLPNMVYMNQVKEQIENLVAKKKIIQIDELYNDSTEFEMRFIIVLKQGADTEYVKNVLYQNTSLQITQRINFEMLDKLTPIRLSYKNYLLAFIENRKQTKYRVFVNRLRVIETRMHEREAFIKLLESPKFEEIMEKIRKFNKEDKDLIEYLIKQLNITDLQAKYIIDSKLRGITRNALAKLKSDFAKLDEMRGQYMDLITNDAALTQYIVDELQQIKQKYGCPRRSKLIHKPGAKDSIPKGAMLVAVTERGFIKKVPAGHNLGVFKNDTVKYVLEIDNADNLIVFDSSGKVYKVPIWKLPFGDRNSAGVDLKFVIKSFNGVCVNAFPEETLKKFRVKNKSKNRMFVITLTKQGYMKKMEVEEFIDITSAGLTYAKMDKDDYMQTVALIYSGNDIIVFDRSKAIRIPESSIPTMKRPARGNATMKSRDVDGLVLANNSCDFMIVVTKSGRLNKIAIDSIPGMKANKKEFSIIRLGKTDSIQNVLFANNGQTLEIRCFSAGVFEFPVSTIVMGSSITGGDKVLSLKNDQIIYSLIK